jgi:hypothetical protein
MPIPSEPEGFPYHQWYRLERRRLPMAAEIPASQTDRRAWVIVYPLTEAGFIVEYYEVERERYEEACDTWDWDLLGIKLNEQKDRVRDDVELLAVLRRRLTDLSLLRDPVLSDVPIW